MSVDYVTLSNLIIDDIVFPDGKTFMNTLGGAGLHALVGMRVWSDRLGYAATVGPDLDEAHRVTLARFGIDLAGLILRPDYDTARAWQVFERDETRIEIFRTSEDAFEQNKIRGDELPASYLQGRGFHLQWGTLAELVALLERLRAERPDLTLVYEPSTTHLELAGPAFRSAMPLVSLFSPDRGEGALITGQSEPLAMIDVLLEWGAPLVALRMGEYGSLVRTRDGAGWRLPAVPATIVDVTGAGNSYCGGFLTGLGDGLPPLEAAMRASVSASFALEQFGLPDWSAPPAAEVQRRLDWLRPRVESLPT